MGGVWGDVLGASVGRSMTVGVLLDPIVGPSAQTAIIDNPPGSSSTVHWRAWAASSGVNGPSTMLRHFSSSKVALMSSAKSSEV